MSTRRLPRIIVEGGRTSTYKSDVRKTHSKDRRAVREFCNQARFDVELPEAVLDERPHVPTRRGDRFADRLTVMRRWLKQRAGRPWDDVYSEARQQADVRTMKGWHYLDHLKKAVFLFGYPRRWTPLRGPHVDAEGLLAFADSPKLRLRHERPKKPSWAWNRWQDDPQLKTMFRLQRVRQQPFPTIDPAVVIDTLFVRRVVIEGRTLYWGVNVAPPTMCLHCRNRFNLNICNHGHWRQDTKLTDVEVALWRLLPEALKRHLRWKSRNRLSK